MLKSLLRAAGIASLVLSLGACSSVARLFGKKETPPAPEPTKKFQVVESDFEWAMQSFEAGQYEDALARFQKVSRGGGANSRNDIILFYQGKCLFGLGRINEAVPKLELFLERNLSHPKAQEARFSLLNSLAQLREWKKVTLLAADTLRLESLAGNRILVQLIWGQALVELGELTGAEKSLQEAKPLFASLPDHSLVGDIVSESKSSLADRALWLGAHLDFARCRKIAPPGQNNKRSTAIKSSQDWARNKGKCLHKAISASLESFPALGPRWQHALEQSISEAIDHYFASVTSIAQGPNSAAGREAATTEIRKHFYQILERLAQAEPPPGLSEKPRWSPRPFITRIEQGLQKIAVDSAQTDKTL